MGGLRQCFIHLNVHLALMQTGTGKQSPMPTFGWAAKNASARGAVTAPTITPLRLVDFHSRVESPGADGFAYHVHPGELLAQILTCKWLCTQDCHFMSLFMGKVIEP